MANPAVCNPFSTGAFQLRKVLGLMLLSAASLAAQAEGVSRLQQNWDVAQMEYALCAI